MSMTIERFQHFKGNYYWKFGEGIDSETGEISVLYCAEKTIEGEAHGKPDFSKVYIRPKKMFEDTICRAPDFIDMPRFIRAQSIFDKLTIDLNFILDQHKDRILGKG